MSKRADRLTAIRDRLSKANQGGGSYWKPKPGDNHIRILEPVGDMGLEWINVGQHFLSQGEVHVCPKFTLEQRCPICELVSELYAQGDDASKQTARKIQMSKSFWMNIIDRNNEMAGVQIFRAPKTVLDYIAALVTDPSYNDFEQEHFVFDAESGRDVNVKRVGTTMTDTKYSVVPAAKDTPLSKDAAQMDQWLEQAMDLNPVLLTEDPTEDAQFTHDDQGRLMCPVAVEPYDRLKRAVEGRSFEDALEPETVEQEGSDLPFPEDEKPDEVDEAIKARRRPSAARTRRSRR
jgi:hypothetical protein